MAPSKQICLLYAQAESVKAAALKAYLDIQKLINKIVETKAKIKFGILNFADVAGAELLSAIESVAASVAQSALGALSKASAAVLESVFATILKILLAAPTAIFSLIAIPQSQAKDACHKERVFLSRARSNFNVILSIVLKWVDGEDGGKYYEQMKLSMPYIQKAIQLISDMIIALEGAPVSDSQIRNSVFNQSKYAELQANLHQAIQITKPYSLLNEKFRITSTIEMESSTIYRSMAKQINSDYAKDRAKLGKEYLSKMSALDVDHNIQNATQIEIAKNEYSAGMETLNMNRKLNLAKAQIDAKTQATFNASAYLKSIGGASASFVFDMQQLKTNLEDLYKNVGQAFVNYKLSQLMCNSVYNIKDLIRNIMNEMIEMIRKSTNLLGDALIKSMQSSQSLIEIVSEDFTKDMDKFEKSQPISSIQLSQSVFAGNMLLSAADANLDATVTESLIQLINSDDVLLDSTGKYDKFIHDLSQIPDWDGAKDVWAVDLLNSAPSPYIQFIAGITEMMVSVPALAISPNGKKSISALLTSANKSFDTILRHNSLVNNALYSYVPYAGSEVGDLMRFLANAGLLQSFAIGMSVSQLVSKLAMDLSTNFDTDFPSYENCMKEYSDDPAFKNPQLALAAIKNELNVTPHQYSKGVQKFAEESWNDVMRLKKQVSSFRLNPKPTDLFNHNSK
jgi:hypothetical protein